MEHETFWQTRKNAIILTIVMGCMAGASLGLLRAGLRERQSYTLYLERQAHVTVQPPGRRPVPGQRDLDIAVALFSIRVGQHIEGPTFDAALEDRGLTVGSTLPGPRTVSIGPAAFTSWAVLGSTLGHEIEVHGQQSFLSIVLLDELSRHAGGFFQSWTALARPTAAGIEGPLGSSVTPNFGTWKAERDAYEYELRQAKRFGLSQEEQDLIRSVMRAYYPDSLTNHRDDRPAQHGF